MTALERMEGPEEMEAGKSGGWAVTVSRQGVTVASRRVCWPLAWRKVGGLERHTKGGVSVARHSVE